MAEVYFYTGLKDDLPVQQVSQLADMRSTRNRVQARAKRFQGVIESDVKEYLT